MQMQGEFSCPSLCNRSMIFREQRNRGKGKHQTKKGHKIFRRKLHLFVTIWSDIIPSPAAFTIREWSPELMGWEPDGPPNPSKHDILVPDECRTAPVRPNSVTSLTKPAVKVRYWKPAEFLHRFISSACNVLEDNSTTHYTNTSTKEYLCLQHENANFRWYYVYI